MQPPNAGYVMPMCTWKNRKFIKEKTQARAVGHAVKEALFDKQLDGKPADSKGQSANVSEKNENPLSREGTIVEKVPIDIQTPHRAGFSPGLPKGSFSPGLKKGPPLA